MGDLMLWTIRQIQISLAFQILPTKTKSKKIHNPCLNQSFRLSDHFLENLSVVSQLIKSGEDVIVVDE